MNNQQFEIFLSKHNVVFSDGATGTNLIARGLPRGITAEHWVLENPDAILQLHQDFIESGSDIILTSTFGGSRIRLKHAGLDDKFKSVNTRGVEIAKQAASGTPVLIAGSIGPLGEMLQPLGLLTYAQAVQEYSDQAKLLEDAGADLLVIETQFDLSEAKAAIEGVRKVSRIALICSFSFDRGKRTMMGVSPNQFAEAVKDFDLSALGINCGKSIEDNQQCLHELRAITHLPIWFKPNAGLPEIDEDGMASYSLKPAEMGEFAKDWPSMGAKIIGGCCGTSPSHLANIKTAIIN